MSEPLVTATAIKQTAKVKSDREIRRQKGLRVKPKRIVIDDPIVADDKEIVRKMKMARERAAKE